MSIRVIELFAGIGAPRCALERVSKATGVEFEFLGISEIDKFAIQSYEAIFGKTENFGDIKNIEKLPDADLWVYGFPCQDISRAGLKKGIDEGTRSGCLLEVMRLLETSKRPEWLVMENVADLVSKRFLPDFEAYIDYLSSLGYQSKWQVMNASKHGVAQSRKRVIMVSRLDAEPPEFPEEEPLTKCLGDYLEDDADPKYFLSQKMLDGFRRSSDFNQRERDACGCKFSIKDVKEVAFSITTKPGQRMTDNFIVDRKTDCHRVGTIDTIKGHDLMKRVYGVDASSPTIPTATGGGHIPKIMPNSECIRRLSPRECWRLMDRSDEEFDKAMCVCSDTQLYKQAGNSIVVRVLEKVFLQMFGGSL